MKLPHYLLEKSYPNLPHQIGSKRVKLQILIKTTMNSKALFYEALRAMAVSKNGSAYGIRTRAPALRGLCPNRLDERAMQPSKLLDSVRAGKRRNEVLILQP